MLDIPTAKSKYQTWRAGRDATPAGGVEVEGDFGAAGTTGLAPGAPTAYSKTTPYEYAGRGWEDPIAQQVMKDYYASGRYGEGAYDQLMGMTGSAPNTMYNSPLSPESWGSVYQGQDFADIADKYKAAGGTYYESKTPAQLAGVPYNTATGEPAPVMNMQTGVPETPIFDAAGNVTGHTPTPRGGSGSSHSLSPEVLSKMWR